MRTRGRSATAVLTMKTALNGIELCQVVDVLGAGIVAGAELALLLRRQAVHAPPSDGPRGKRTRRVIKMRSAQARRAPAATPREPPRVDINPASAGRSQFDPDRQPVCFCHITQIAENRETSRQILCLHSEIKISVLSGLPASQRLSRNAPQPHPAHPGLQSHPQRACPEATNHVTSTRRCDRRMCPSKDRPHSAPTAAEPGVRSEYAVHIMRTHRIARMAKPGERMSVSGKPLVTHADPH